MLQVAQIIWESDTGKEMQMRSNCVSIAGAPDCSCKKEGEQSDWPHPLLMTLVGFI